MFGPRFTFPDPGRGFWVRIWKVGSGGDSSYGTPKGVEARPVSRRPSCGCRFRFSKLRRGLRPPISHRTHPAAARDLLEEELRGGHHVRSAWLETSSPPPATIPQVLPGYSRRAFQFIVAPPVNRWLPRSFTPHLGEHDGVRCTPTVGRGEGAVLVSDARVHDLGMYANGVIPLASRS